MAAFSSNIDITSGGTYAMDVTNGETSAKVATDLNGKFANIQELLRNGLPEVWTGSSLPDSLPNGKIIYQNNNLYQSNLLRLLTETDYNTLNSLITTSINKKVICGIYTGNGAASQLITLGYKPALVLVLESGARIYNYDGKSDFYGGMALPGHPASVNGMTAVRVENTGFRVYYGWNSEITICARTNSKNETYNYLVMK